MTKLFNGLVGAALVLSLAASAVAASTNAVGGIKNNPLRTLLERNGSLAVSERDLPQDITSGYGYAYRRQVDGSVDNSLHATRCSVFLSENAEALSKAPERIIENENIIPALLCDLSGELSPGFVQRFNVLNENEQSGIGLMAGFELSRICRNLERAIKSEGLTAVKENLSTAYSTYHNLCNAISDYPFKSTVP